MEPICQRTDCQIWEPDKEECDDCVDGRFIGAVCEYASTCDGCGDLTMHEEMHMDEETQLGYCEKCMD
jgi:hypothetical protein